MVWNARRLGVAASLAWLLVVAVLAVRGDIGIAVWRLYCHFAVDTNCEGTSYIVVHWHLIAILMFVPVVLGWLLGWIIRALVTRIGA